MSDYETLKTSGSSEQENYSLNDDRRVKTLSPGALVLRRFMRNRVAVTGLTILIFMALFSFVGGLITPYKEDQLFYSTKAQKKQYAAVKESADLRYITPSKDSFPSVAQAKFILALKNKKDSFDAKGRTFTYTLVGDELVIIFEEGQEEPVALATTSTVSSAGSDAEVPFLLQHEILKAYWGESEGFTYEGEEYTISEEGAVFLDGEEVAYISRFIVQPIMSDVTLSRGFKEALIGAVQAGEKTFVYTDEDGTEASYDITFDAANKNFKVLQTVETRVFDTYHEPTKEHWLGTDKNGMDMLTRLMYGGRVSLYIGFIVVIIETLIGVVLGGISGYCGGWVDMLIMRIVDIFYCIPSMPIIIILGAAMDAMRVDPQIRMIYLMLILGFLGWPSIARLVRGQILTLREQEFMTAAEATGIRASRRIFKHLIPNVIPQLIVTMTMSLGSTILTEATLSFLGLGVKFPFASWGNIINDVNNTHVLTNYWFIWIPAGVCLLATVLAFNLVGDGLRDAFDPKMKR